METELPTKIEITEMPSKETLEMFLESMNGAKPSVYFDLNEGKFKGNPNEEV